MVTVKIIFQDPETMLWEVDGKQITTEQFEALQNLFPSVQWILIHWTDPKTDTK